MIKPSKYLNLRLSVLNVSASILSKLAEDNVIRYDELLIYLKETIGDDVKSVYLESLSFLFLLGKIKYHKNLDSFELTNEAK